MLCLAEEALQRRCLIFALHRVLPANEAVRCYSPHLVLTEEAFADCVAFMVRNSDLVPLHDLSPELLKDSRSRFSVLTFDDGWEDNYRVVFPVLRHFKVPATIFLPTALIGSHKLLPEERLWRLWQAAELRGALREVRADMQQRLGATENGNDTGYPHWHRALKVLPMAEKLGFLLELESRYSPGVLGSDRYPFLTWAQAREMTAAGVDFGSHTVNHCLLTQESDEVASRELRVSLGKVQSETGTKSALFAYPSGSYDARVRRLTEQVGYSHAVITKPGGVEKNYDRLLLPRIPLDSTVLCDDVGRFSEGRFRLQNLRAAI